MDSKDDPEERIRELERGISEQARASELGVGPDGTSALPPPLPPPLPSGSYGTPYPPASTPGSYGTPYPPAPSYGAPPPGSFGTPYPPGPGTFGDAPFSPVRSSSGFRVGWLIFAVFAVVGLGVLGTVVAVFYNVSHSISSIESSFPTFSDDGTLTNVPSIPGVPAPSGSPTTTPIAAGHSVNVSGSGRHETLVCDGGSVTISGMKNTVDITGHCAKVTVSGVQNTVDVESAEDIEASGMKNAVTYHSGDPRVNKSGLDNSVDAG